MTAAAAAALVAEVVSPFGLNVGPDGTAITSILVAVGIAAGLIEQAIHA